MKILLGAVAALIVLAGVVMLAVTVLVDPNDYRDRIAELVEQKTGRSLSIAGDLSLKLFPCCGIGIGETSLSNPGGFGDSPFVSIDQARIGLKLWPLLFERKLEIGEVKLSGLQLDLVRRADGTVNWEFPSTELDAEQAPEAEQSGNEQGPELTDLSVAGIRVVDADIRYQDKAAGTDYRIRNIELKTGPIDKDKPFDLQASLELSDQAGMSARVELESVMALELDEQAVQLQVLKAELVAQDLLKLTIDATGRASSEDMALSGHFELAAFSPRQLANSLEVQLPPTADPQAFTKLEASGDWQLEPDRVSLKTLDLEFDDTHITGSGGISHFDSPAIGFEFAADRLDLDRYLPASDGQSPEAASQSGTGVGADQSLDSLKTLNLDGRLELDELVVSGAQLSELQAVIRAREGVIRLDPMTARLYQGSYKGAVGLDLSSQPPRVELEQQLDGVQLGGLLADAAEIEQLDGTVHAEMKLAGNGLSEGELLKSMAGPLSFSLSDGIYKGMDIWREIRKARALIRGKPAPPVEGPPQTRITDLQMTGKVANGVMHSNRLVAEIPFLRMTGTGSVDLLKQLLDYRLQAEVFDRPEFDGEKLDDLTGLVIPLTVTGAVESPKIGVDLAGLAKSVAGKKLQDKLFKELGLDDSTEGKDTGQGEESRSTEDSLKRDLKKLLPF